MFREGDPVELVYIVKEGEFEFTKRKVVEDKVMYNYEKLIGPRKDELGDDENVNVVEKVTKSDLPSSKIEHRALDKRKKENQKLGTMASGHLFGEEDIVCENATRKMTVFCKTKSGTLLCMKKEEFLKKFKNHEESWSEILKIVMFKGKVNDTRIKKFERITQDLQNPVIKQE